MQTHFRVLNVSWNDLKKTSLPCPINAQNPWDMKYEDLYSALSPDTLVLLCCCWQNLQYFHPFPRYSRVCVLKSVKFSIIYQTVGRSDKAHILPKEQICLRHLKWMLFVQYKKILTSCLLIYINNVLSVVALGFIKKYIF